MGKSRWGGDGNGTGDGNDSEQRTVADFVTSWGEKYQTAATTAIATEQYKDIDQYTLDTVSNYCPFDVVHIITTGMRKLLNEADFPADNWLNYVDVMLSSYLQVPHANTQLFSSQSPCGMEQSCVRGGGYVSPSPFPVSFLLCCVSVGTDSLDLSFPNIFHLLLVIIASLLHIP